MTRVNIVSKWPKKHIIVTKNHSILLYNHLRVWFRYSVLNHIEFGLDAVSPEWVTNYIKQVSTKGDQQEHMVRAMDGPYQVSIKYQVGILGESEG